ncbi:MAG: SAM-dependent methyltransferase [Solirubrobacteraceae bacterium]
MASRADIEFTYATIDRIFRLSLGELADFSGAKHDGDFSLTLEQAQRRKHEYIAAALGIEPGRRLLDLGCGWGAVRLRARSRRSRRRRSAVRGAGRLVPPLRAQRPPQGCARGGPRYVRIVRRRRESRRLGAFLLARGLPRRAPGGDLPQLVRERRWRASQLAGASTCRRWCSGAT